MVAIRIVHLTEPAAEGNLHLRIKVEATEHEDTFGLERFGDGCDDRCVVEQSIGSDARDLGADRLRRLLDRDRGHDIREVWFTRVGERRGGSITLMTRDRYHATTGRARGPHHRDPGCARGPALGPSPAGARPLLRR